MSHLVNANTRSTDLVVLVRRPGFEVKPLDEVVPLRDGDEMQVRLSAAAGAPVTVKGRRAESMGALGRAEGIACWAVALIDEA